MDLKNFDRFRLDISLPRWKLLERIERAEGERSQEIQIFEFGERVDNDYAALQERGSWWKSRRADSIDNAAANDKNGAILGADVFSFFFFLHFRVVNTSVEGRTRERNRDREKLLVNWLAQNTRSTTTVVLSIAIIFIFFTWRSICGRPRGRNNPLRSCRTRSLQFTEAISNYVTPEDVSRNYREDNNDNNGVRLRVWRKLMVLGIRALVEWQRWLLGWDRIGRETRRNRQIGRTNCHPTGADAATRVARGGERGWRNQTKCKLRGGN